MEDFDLLRAVLKDSLRKQEKKGNLKKIEMFSIEFAVSIIIHESENFEEALYKTLDYLEEETTISNIIPEIEGHFIPNI